MNRRHRRGDVVFVANKTLYESPPSPTQPLLEDHQPAATASDHASDDPDHSQFLQISYNNGPRSFKDLPFLILFALVILLTFGFGIFSVAHSSSTLSSSYYYDSTSSSCLLNSTSLHASTKSKSISKSNRFFVSESDDLLKGLIWALLIPLLLSFPIAWRVLVLLKYYTKQLVYVTLPFFILLPVAVNVYWFVACTVSSTCTHDFPDKDYGME